MTPAYRHFDRTAKRQLGLLDPEENEASAVARVVLPILTRGLGISEQDVRLETSIPHGSLRDRTGRADIVISMAGRAVLLVECKAPRVSLHRFSASQKAVEQAERYAVRLGVDHIVVTNGHHWILRSGHETRMEASSRDEFVNLGRYFFTWLNPIRLWYWATRLVVPNDFEFGRRLVDRCRKKQVTLADLARLRKMRRFIPEALYDRLEEEVHKTLAVLEINRLARMGTTSKNLAVVHLDPTFASYRQGAWLYDPIYRWHRMNESEILKSCARPQFGETAVRVFIVSDKTVGDWAVRMPEIGAQMLREGWTTAMINERDLLQYDLYEGDVIGDYVIAGYAPGEAFDYRFERNPRLGARLRSRLGDYMSTKPDFSFSPGKHGAARLFEHCAWIARTVNAHDRRARG
jgi:hypothetical protein